MKSHSQLTKITRGKVGKKKTQLKNDQFFLKKRMRMKLDTKGKRNQMVRDKIEKNSVNKNDNKK